MKKYLILFIVAILYFSITANAQSKKIIEHYYSFDTAKINKGRDTLTIIGTESIKVIFENTTLSDGKQLIRIIQLKNEEESEDVTNTLSSKHLLIEAGSPIKLVLTFRDTPTSGNKTSSAVALKEKKFVLVLFKANEKVEKTLDEKIKEVEKEILSGLFNEKTDSKKVLMFTLNSKKILPQFTNPKDSAKNKDLKDSLLIDSISITFLNGKISRGGMYVKLRNGDYYRNQKRSFSVSKKKYDKYLYIDNSID